MAVVNCPERGYAVKEHYLTEEEKQRLTNKKTEYRRLEIELNNKHTGIDRLHPLTKPKEPKLAKHMFYCGRKITPLSRALIISVIILILCITTKSRFFIFLLAIFRIIVIPFSIYITYLDFETVYSRYKRDYAEWKLQAQVSEDYKNQV